MQNNQIEDRRVSSAVIGRVGDELEMRELSEAHLMRNFARLGVAIVVMFCGL